MQKKILFFVDCFEMGGIQIFLKNLLSHIDNKIFKSEFLVLDDGKTHSLEEEIISLGGTIHKLNGVWLNKPSDYINYCYEMDKFFKKNHTYEAVHINASSKNFMILYYAKKYKISKRIMHSHNTGYQTTNSFNVFMGNIFKIPMKMWATDYFACSKVAGEWLFGKATCDKLIIIPNGIELEKYRFNSLLREHMRKELGLEEKDYVVGNVGRFVTQKNHEFILDIFEEIVKIKKNSYLILVGVGELMNKCKSIVRMKKIENNVKFLGYRTDVDKILQAIDVFLMPSFHEGFPVTAIEAQATGCPCVFADIITNEAAIIKNSMYISLNEPSSVWAKKILNIEISNAKRKETNKILKEKGFDIADIADFLQAYYLK